MKRLIDAIRAAWLMVAAIPCAIAACRDERHDARLKAIDGGMTPEEARRAYP